MKLLNAVTNLLVALALLTIAMTLFIGVVKALA